MTLIDMKDVLPATTLPRYNCTKKLWLKPARLDVKELNNGYEVSFLTRRNKGLSKIKCTIPRYLEITDKFKCALTAYICEGTNQTKGLNAEVCGNKTKHIHITNSDSWVLKLVIDEFEKLGIKRERWRIRLYLFSQQYTNIEKVWWMRQLNVPFENFKYYNLGKGDLSKAYREPHGRAKVELESVILGSLVANLINLLKVNRI